MILGIDLILSMGTGTPVPVCHSKSCTLSRSRDYLTITDPTGPDEKYLPSIKRGTVAAEGLMVYKESINGISVLEWLENGSLVGFSFRTSASGGLIISGKMYIDHWEETGDYSSALSYSFTGKINGPMQIVKSTVQKTVYLADVTGVRLPQCPNPYPANIFWYDGTLLGIAYDVPDVISLFNSYPVNKDLRLTGFSSGCDFTLSVGWTAETSPDWIVAENISDRMAIAASELNIIGDGDVAGLSPTEIV
ncbi:hypothetical protein HF324_18415 [Chitinophaga oryzae]|uniref:Uncharacterized protein n=1 Tax=Chitinophaga oryzae TaxID=2725414 RepID=A0ABX6LIX7_9BACT|nr:hypothetical protein [Chitinophaga oryzae]QJB39723.1 hypothetical protein HF324_18415 [Chitinophaga oryzae]